MTYCAAQTPLVAEEASEYAHTVPKKGVEKHQDFRIDEEPAAEKFKKLVKIERPRLLLSFGGANASS